MFFHSFLDTALKLQTSKNGGIQRNKAKGCAYAWDLIANRYDDIAVGSFDRFEQVVDGPTENILDIVFSGINLEVKNWQDARSFFPITGDNNSAFRQLKAYFTEGKDFAYYFNKNGGVSVAGGVDGKGGMRLFLKNVFANDEAMESLWEVNKDLFKNSLPGVSEWEEVRDMATNANTPQVLEDFLQMLIKE